nr:MAG: wsv442-like protein [Penaeus semisulcatus pemonivirus]
MQREHSFYASFSNFSKGRGGHGTTTTRTATEATESSSSTTEAATAAAATATAAAEAEARRERFNALVAPGLLISINNDILLLTSSAIDSGDACAHIIYSDLALEVAINERRLAIENNFENKDDDEVMNELTPMYVINQIQHELNRSNAIFMSQITSVTIDAGSMLFSKTKAEHSTNNGSGGILWLRNRLDPIGLDTYRISTVLSMLPKASENVAPGSDRYVVIADVISLLIAIALETARLTKGKLTYIPDGHCLFLAIPQEGLVTRLHGIRRDLRLIINDPMGCGWRILGKDPFTAATAAGKGMEFRYRANFWTELATKCVCSAIFRSPSPEQLRDNVVSTGQCPSKWPILPGITLRVWTNPLTSQIDLAKTRVSAKGCLTVTVTSRETIGESYSPPIGAWLSGHSATGIESYGTECSTEFSLILGPPGNRVSVEPKFPVHMNSSPISEFTRRRINQRRLATLYSSESEENGGMLTINVDVDVDDKRVLVLEKLSLCFSSLVVHKYMWSAVKRHPSWTKLIRISDSNNDLKSQSLCMDILEQISGMTLSPVLLSGGFRRDRLSYEMWMIGKNNKGLQVIRILKKSTANGNANELTIPLFSFFSGQECQWQNRATATWSAPGERYIFTPRCLHHSQFSSVHVYDEHGNPPVGFGLSIQSMKRFTSTPDNKHNASSKNHWGLIEEVQAGQWNELSQRSYESSFLQHPLAIAAITMAITKGVHESCFLLVNGSRKSRVVDLPIQAPTSSSSFSSTKWSITSLLRIIERGDTSPERPSQISYVKTVSPESFRVRISKAQYPRTGTAIRDPCPSEIELASMLEDDLDNNKVPTANKYRSGGIEPNPGYCETIIIDVM